MKHRILAAIGLALLATTAHAQTKIGDHTLATIVAPTDTLALQKSDGKTYSVQVDKLVPARTVPTAPLLAGSGGQIVPANPATLQAEIGLTVPTAPLLGGASSAMQPVQIDGTTINLNSQTLSAKPATISSGIGYQSSWTGATQNQLGKRLGAEMSLTDFVPAGQMLDTSGATDVSAIINAGLTAVCAQPIGVSLHFPAGTYLYGTPFARPTNCTHIAMDAVPHTATIKRAPGNNAQKWFISEGVIGTLTEHFIDNGVDIDGNWAATGYPLGTANATVPLYFTAPTRDTVLRNMSIHDTGGTGIVFAGESRVGLLTKVGSIVDHAGGYYGATSFWTDTQLPNLHVGALLFSNNLTPRFYVTGVTQGTNPDTGQPGTYVTGGRALEGPFQAVTNQRFTPAFTIASPWQTGQTSITIDTTNLIAVGQTIYQPDQPCLPSDTRIIALSGHTITVDAAHAPICPIGAGNTNRNFASISGNSDVVFENVSFDNIGYLANVNAANWDFYTAGPNVPATGGQPQTLKLQSYQALNNQTTRFGIQPGNYFGPYTNGPTMPDGMPNPDAVATGAVDNNDVVSTTAYVSSGDPTTLHITAIQTGGNSANLVQYAPVTDACTYKSKHSEANCSPISFPYGVYLVAPLATAQGDVATWQMSDGVTGGVASETVQIGGTYTVTLASPLTQSIPAGTAMPSWGPAPTGNGYDIWAVNGAPFANDNWTFDHLSLGSSWSTGMLLQQLKNVTITNSTCDMRFQVFTTATQQGSSCGFTQSIVNFKRAANVWSHTTGQGWLDSHPLNYSSVGEQFLENATSGLTIAGGDGIQITGAVARNNGQAKVLPLVQDTKNDPFTDYAGSSGIAIQNGQNGGTGANVPGQIFNVNVTASDVSDTQLVHTQAYGLQQFSQDAADHSYYNNFRIDCSVSGVGNVNGLNDYPQIAPQCASPPSNLSPSLPGNYVAGRFYPPMFVTSSAASIGAANTIYLVPFNVPTSGSAATILKSLGIYVTNSNPSTWHWQAAIYTDGGNGRPSAFVTGSSTGSQSVAGGTAGAQLATLNSGNGISLPGGTYWEAFEVDAIGASVTSSTGSGNNLAIMFGQGNVGLAATANTNGFTTSATFGTMPSTVSGFTSAGTLPLVYLGF